MAASSDLLSTGIAMQRTQEHFNGLSEAEAERLAVLAEECAEVIKAISKILRHGYESVNPHALDSGDRPPETNRSALERELGDARCATDMLILASDVSGERVLLASQSKAMKIRRWLHHA